MKKDLNGAFLARKRGGRPRKSWVKIGVNIPPETDAAFRAAYDKARVTRPELTIGEFFTELVTGKPVQPPTPLRRQQINFSTTADFKAKLDRLAETLEKPISDILERSVTTFDQIIRLDEATFEQVRALMKAKGVRGW